MKSDILTKGNYELNERENIAMKCPCCNKDMKKGFVRALGRGGICWVKDIYHWSAPREDSEFFQIGKATLLNTDHVPAFNCDSCELIIID